MRDKETGRVRGWGRRGRETERERERERGGGEEGYKWCVF